jgi:hypothetical protein
VSSRILITLALAAATVAPVIRAQDAQVHGQQEPQAPPEVAEAWPMATTGDITVLIIRERYRIYADHCAGEVPALKAGFDEVMKSLQGRIRSIGMRLLDTDAYADMKQQEVSPTLVGALSAELADIRQELEDQDPDDVCPATLQSYRGVTDEQLQDFLQRTLAGVRITARTLKAGGAQ